MTLKTVLKNFLNYADTLEAQKKLGKDLYEVDFQVLHKKILLFSRFLDLFYMIY